MKAPIDQFWIDAAQPATGKSVKQHKAGKKKNGQQNAVNRISPDSYNVRGSAANAGYLRHTPAP